MGKLDGKVAIVTGAARGLGRAYALKLASLGARVAVSDLNLRSWQEFDAEARSMTGDTTMDEIRAMGGESMGYEFDVADRDAMQAMVDDVHQTWGSVDVLVANAGGGRGKPRETAASIVPPDLFDLVLKMNLYGTYHACSAVAPIMKAQRSGKIVTVASIAGKVAGIGGGYAHYGAAKAAIAHYTRNLAQELGPYGINANCIAPGIIATARIVQLVGGSESSNSAVNDIALRRFGTPEDCARVIEFLATDLSDYVTGALIPIDGGQNRSD
ncbi:MAG: SDR family oxidoreductase [Pseudomonadales bacterium]|nr:SDR family oxidoreductase [Pseudomonadales bacterium]MCP5185454.1 SDR family oxidoreductase [Pseudomonadales bacterium]